MLATPGGFTVSSYAPSMTLDLIRSHFSPGARPFIIQAALRGAFLNLHLRTDRSRFDDERIRLFRPPHQPSLRFASAAHSSPRLVPIFLFITPHLFRLSLVPLYMPPFPFVLGAPEIPQRVA